MARGFRRIRADPLTFLEQTTIRYGDLVAFPVPGPPVLLVNDPQGVRRVLQSGARLWGKHTIQYAALATVTGPGLLAVADDSWLERRRVAQPAFHRERLDVVAESVAAAARKAVQRWGDLPADGALVDVDALAMEMTLDVIGRTLFDHDLTDATARLVHATDEAAELIVAQGRSAPLPAWVRTRSRRRMGRAVRELDAICQHVVAARRVRGATRRDTDLLGLLVSAGLPDGAIRDELVTMVVAGHETVASSLTWTLMLLAEHPEAQSRARTEVRRADPASAVDLSGSLPWTRAVIDESLRLYPPGWVVSRRAREPDVLAGQRVPAGTVAIISPWVLHRSPRSWPQPEEFRPERFVGEQTTARPDYVPFGLGPRLCIGRDFALLELTVILRALLRDHEVRLPARWRRPALDAFVTLRPRGGLTLRVLPAR